MSKSVVLVEWLRSDDEHNLQYLADIDGVRHHVKLNAQRDPQGHLLIYTVFNTEMHQRVIENIAYAIDVNGNFLPEHRHVVANSHFHFFRLHNTLNWRFSSDIQFVSEEELAADGNKHEIFASTRQYVKDNRVATIVMTIKDTPLVRVHMTYLHGADNLHPDLEALLDNEAAGYVMKTTIPHYFGVWDAGNVETFDKNEIPKEITKEQVGRYVTFKDERGFEFVGKISAFADGIASIDTNDVWSRLKTAEFVEIEVEILCIRDATKEELALGVPILK